MAVEFSNSDAILTLAGIPELEVTVWNWKDGEKIASFSLNTSLMQPEHICFSPTNWRHITVAYKSEINVWNLELCEPKRMKAVKKRIRLPLSDQNIGKELSAVGPGIQELKDEFQYSFNAISGLNENVYGSILEDILDKRPRHTFKSLCWSSVDEIMISSNENYIFKVGFYFKEK